MGKRALSAENNGPPTDRPPAPPADPSVERRETALEKADRNWNDLLQELRVLQTGIQILTGFLLTLPFQPRFRELSPAQILVRITIVLVRLILIGPLSLIFDLVLGTGGGLIAGASLAAVLTVLWGLLPRLIRRRALHRHGV